MLGIRTFDAALREVTRNVDVHGVLVIDDSANVTHRSMNEELFLFAELPSLLGLRIGQWTWVAEDLDALDVQVAYTRDMHPGSQPVVGTAKIAVDSNRTIAFTLGLSDLFARCEVLKTVGKHVGM